MSIYTVKDVAELLDVTEENVRRWCRSGRLIATKDSKKNGFKISRQDLVEFASRIPRYAIRLDMKPVDTDDMFCSLAELIRQRDELNERISKIQDLLRGGL